VRNYQLAARATHAVARSTWGRILSILTRVLSAVAAVDPSAVPAATRQRCAEIVADSIGAIGAGNGLDCVRAYTRTLRPLGPDHAEAAITLGSDATWVAPEDAAFVNGVAGCALELDEAFRPWGHPAMHVVPAALASRRPGTEWSRTARRRTGRL